MLDPEGTETFESQGKKFTAVFGFRAMKQVEKHFDLPFLQAIMRVMPAVTLDTLEDQDKLRAAASSVRFTDLGVLFGAALVKHHPGLTEDEIDELIDDIGLERVSEIIGNTVASSVTQGGDDSSPTNPPKPQKRPKR